MRYTIKNIVMASLSIGAGLCLAKVFWAALCLATHTNILEIVK